MKKKLYIGKSIGAFLVVLLLMPLGHAMMALMEHFLATETLHYCAFAMGFVGLIVTIWGVFAKGDTHQTIFGIVGAMLFWTGWVEFLFVYYAQRFGVHCDLYGSGVIQTTTQYVDGLINHQEYLINGTPLEDYSRAELKAMRGSRPEYLIMPATFGMWVVVMLFYVFCTKTGCDFINWLQNHCLPKSRRFSNLKGGIRVGIRNSSIVTFMEWNVMMWGIYLLMMFCYDPVFLGQDHHVPFHEGDDVEHLSADDVLLRSRIPGAGPSCDYYSGTCQPCKFDTDAEKRIAYCCLGAQHTLCTGYRHRVLDLRGDHGP